MRIWMLSTRLTSLKSQDGTLHSNRSHTYSYYDMTHNDSYLNNKATRTYAKWRSESWMNDSYFESLSSANLRHAAPANEARACVLEEIGEVSFRAEYGAAVTPVAHHVGCRRRTPRWPPISPVSAWKSLRFYCVLFQPPPSWSSCRSQVGRDWGDVQFCNIDATGLRNQCIYENAYHSNKRPHGKWDLQ